MPRGLAANAHDSKWAQYYSLSLVVILPMQNIPCAMCINTESKIIVCEAHTTREHGNLQTEKKKRTYRSRAIKFYCYFYWCMRYCLFAYSYYNIIGIFLVRISIFRFHSFNVRRSHGLSVASVCLLWFQYNYVCFFARCFVFDRAARMALRCNAVSDVACSTFYQFIPHSQPEPPSHKCPVTLAMRATHVSPSPFIRFAEILCIF